MTHNLNINSYTPVELIFPGFDEGKYAYCRDLVGKLEDDEICKKWEGSNDYIFRRKMSPDRILYFKNLDGYSDIPHSIDILIGLFVTVNEDTVVDILVGDLCFGGLYLKKGENRLPVFGRANPLPIVQIPFYRIALHFPAEISSVRALSVALKDREHMWGIDHYITLIDEKSAFVTNQGTLNICKIDDLNIPLREKLRRLKLTRTKNFVRKYLPEIMKRLYRPEGRLASRLADAFFP